MPGFDIVLMKEYKIIAAKYTFLPSCQVKKKALEKLKKSTPQNKMKLEKSEKKKPQTPKESTPLPRASFDDFGKRKRSVKPLNVSIVPTPKRGLLKTDGRSNHNGHRVSFNSNPEIRYRTESEASSTSTSKRESIIDMDDFVYHTVEQNSRNYSRKNLTNSKPNKNKSDKIFDELLNSNCTWSYKQFNRNNNESSNCSRSEDSISGFLSTVNNKTSYNDSQTNKKENNSHSETVLHTDVINVDEAVEKSVPNSFDSLISKGNTAVKANGSKHKKDLTGRKRNLRSLKQINYANESSSDEELVLQCRVYNRSKLDSDEDEDGSNVEESNANLNDEILEDVDEKRMGDSPPCNGSYALENEAIDTTKSISDSADKYSYVENLKGKVDMNDDSLSPEILTNKTNSNKNKISKESPTPEDIKQLNASKSKKHFKTKRDIGMKEKNMVELEDSDYCEEISTYGDCQSIPKVLTSIEGIKNVSREQLSDSDHSNFFRTSFPNISNDEAECFLGSDNFSFDDSDASTKTESKTRLLDVSESKRKECSNEEKSFEQRDCPVKKNFPSEIPTKAKRYTDSQCNTSTPSDFMINKSKTSSKCKKKIQKAHDLDIDSLPSEIKNLHNAISSEIQAIGCKNDMSGSLSEDDDIITDFFNGSLNCNKLAAYCKSNTIQKYPKDNKLDKKSSLNASIQKGKEFESSLHLDESLEEMTMTENSGSNPLKETQKSKLQVCVQNLNTIAKTIEVKELTSVSKQNTIKSKPEKRYATRSRQPKQSLTKTNEKKKEQEIEVLDLTEFDDPHNNGLREFTPTRNRNTEIAVQKKESKLKARDGGNSKEKSNDFSTPSLCSNYSTVPVKHKTVSQVVVENKSKVQRSSFEKDETKVLGERKPPKSWDDLTAELLPTTENNSTEFNNTVEEISSYWNDDGSKFISSERNRKNTKAGKHKSNTISKAVSVPENNAMNAFLNESSRKNTKIKYTFSSLPNKDNQESRHTLKNKPTMSMVPYAKNTSIIEKTIANMNRSTSQFLKPVNERHMRPIERNSDEDYSNGFPVEFSYSIQEIKSTMYIKPAKQMQKTVSQKRILNTGKKTTPNKQDKNLTEITSPMSLPNQVLPVTWTDGSSDEELDNMITTKHNLLALKTMQKPNRFSKTEKSPVNPKIDFKFGNAKEKAMNTDDSSAALSEDQNNLVDSTENTDGEKIEYEKRYTLRKRKSNKNFENINLSSKKPKREIAKHQEASNYRNMDRQKREESKSAKELQSKKHSGTMQPNSIALTHTKNQESKLSKKHHTNEAEDLKMHMQPTSICNNMKRSHNNLSSDSELSDEYQSIDSLEELIQRKSKNMKNGKYISHDENPKHGGSPSVTITEKNKPPKFTKNNTDPSTSKDMTEPKKLKEGNPTDEYQKYLTDIFQNEKDFSRMSFKAGSNIEDKSRNTKPLESKVIKEMDEDSDDVFSISSFGTDNEVPSKGTGLLCDLFDK